MRSDNNFEPYTPVVSDDGLVKITDENGKSQEFPVRWSFSMNITSKTSQPEKVKLDCIQINLTEVGLILVDYPARYKSDMSGHGTVDLDNEDIPGKNHTRGVTATAVNDDEDAEVKTSPVSGKLEESENNISTTITATISPTDDASEKTVTWLVAPSFNLNIATLQTAIKNRILAKLHDHGEGYTVEVSLPNPDDNDYTAWEKVVAGWTNDEPGPGTACELPSNPPADP